MRASGARRRLVGTAALGCPATEPFHSRETAGNPAARPVVTSLVELRSTGQPRAAVPHNIWDKRPSIRLCSRSNPSDQVFLLGAAFGADCERIEHAGGESKLYGFVLPIAHIALAKNFHP